MQRFTHNGWDYKRLFVGAWSVTDFCPEGYPHIQCFLGHGKGNISGQLEVFLLDDDGSMRHVDSQFWQGEKWGELSTEVDDLGVHAILEHSVWWAHGIEPELTPLNVPEKLEEAPEGQQALWCTIRLPVNKALTKDLITEQEGGQAFLDKLLEMASQSSPQFHNAMNLLKVTIISVDMPALRRHVLRACRVPEHLREKDDVLRAFFIYELAKNLHKGLSMTYIDTRRDV